MMDTICGGNRPYLNTNTLDEEHMKSKDKAMEQFVVKRKMGGDEFSESYKFKLETVRQFIHTFCFILLNSKLFNVFK